MTEPKPIRVGAPDIDAKQAEIRRTRKPPKFLAIERLK